MFIGALNWWLNIPQLTLSSIKGIIGMLNGFPVHTLTIFVGEFTKVTLLKCVLIISQTNCRMDTVDKLSICIGNITLTAQRPTSI